MRACRADVRPKPNVSNRLDTDAHDVFPLISSSRLGSRHVEES